MSGAAPKTEPQGELSLRVLGQMDIAGGTHAAGQSGGRTVTVAVDAMKFHKPVHVGDEVTCYTRIVRTSISVMVEPGSVVAVWAIPSMSPRACSSMSPSTRRAHPSKSSIRPLISTRN